MDGGIDINVPLDYIEFQIFPSQNRYEACVCYDDKIEKVTSGLLEHLLQHSAEVKNLQSKGSNANFKLQPPEKFSNTKWFTKSTLIRFLHIIGLSKIINITNTVKNEISQLEEVRRFQLSLYAKGTHDQHKNDESDNSYSNGTASTQRTEDSAELSDASKDELLRAMELRIAALRGELVAAFDQAAGFRYSVEEISDIEKFSHHFGSLDLRDSLRKYVELREGNQAVDTSADKQNTGNNEVSRKEVKNHIKSSYSDTPVKYGVSPAKAAQIERQSSSESEDSFSSEEDQPSLERSRTLVRSASPRRSASPMRRVQIGRSGSRRSTALTIKSLNYFPARERTVLPKDPDADNSDEEANEEAPKKSEINVRRMSVQDAISLFESKQKDQTTDIQKARALLSASVGANKSVLRRWSSTAGESSQCSPDMDSEDASPSVPNNLENKEVSHSSPETKPKPKPKPKPVEHCEVDITMNSPEKGACSAPGVQEESLTSQLTEVSEQLSASAEWSRQKEAELNQLLMKMMETMPVKYQNVVPDKSKSEKLPNEQRGGQYNHYKKGEEKLKGETARKRVEKEKQFSAKQHIPESRKAEMASSIASQASKCNNVKKVQKSQNNIPKSANPKSESTNTGVVKKAVSKSSSLPAIRKSWPTAPSPRSPGAKISPGTTSTGPTTRRRSQQASPVSRSTPKVETSQPKSKPVKPNQNDTKKSGRSVPGKQQRAPTKTNRTPKSKVQSATEDPISSAKHSSYSKVTKKSSVVPLESKPFLRKGSGTISSANPAGKTKTSNQSKESLRNSADLIAAGEKEMIFNSSDAVIQQQEVESEQLKVLAAMESENPAKSPHKCEDTESCTDVTPASYNNSFERMAEPEIKSEVEEESMISPTAWVKMEELDDLPITSGDSIFQIESPVYIAPIRASSPRVRHSLSQMLLEESSEPDISDWGNAENPPAMVYNKDVPKGLKRLLKFARKSKTDANSTGWSSPSVFSEGEDESEDSKFPSKRSAENLLKKATLHSKNNGHQKASCEIHEKPSADYVNLDRFQERWENEQLTIKTTSPFSIQSNKSKYSAPSLSQQLQEGHVSVSATTTKATRSFFSLSAFKGSK